MQAALFEQPSIAEKAVIGYQGLVEDMKSKTEDFSRSIAKTLDGTAQERASTVGSHNEMLQFVPRNSDDNSSIWGYDKISGVH